MNKNNEEHKKPSEAHSETHKEHKEFSENHLFQWIAGSNKKKITEKILRLVKELKEQRFPKWLAFVRQSIKQYPRWWAIGGGVFILVIIMIAVIIGINIGKKGASLDISIEDIKGEDQEFIEKIEKEASQQLQSKISDEFEDSGYRYAVYLKILEDESGKEVKKRLEVYPVTAGSWDNLFNRDREKIIDKLIDIYKQYINKKSGEVHVRNNIEIMATAVWEKGRKPKITINP